MSAPRVDAGPFRLGPSGGDGPAVLCLHGLTGTPYEVRPPAEALAAAGFACLGPKLPGHGADERTLAATPRSAWLEAVCGAFDELAAAHGRVYVLGLSLGGLLALSLAARREVAGVAAVAAPLRLRAAVRHGVPILARFLRSVPKRAAILDPAARRRHPSLDRMPLASVVELLHLQREVAAELHRIRAPLRLYYSRLDPTVHPSNAERILERVASRDTGVEYFTRSGHVIPVDYEGPELSKRVLEFLSTLEAGAGRVPAPLSR